MRALDDLPYIEWADPKSGAVSRIYADAIKHESANLAAVVSKHPVETGANVSDHYRKDNETASIEYFFSGSPIREDLDPDNPGAREVKDLKYPPAPTAGAPIYTPGGLTQAVTGGVASLLGLGPAPLPKTLTVLAFDEQPRRLEKAVETVRALQANGILVTLKTSFGRFEDCGIVGAAVERAPEDGDGGRIRFELEQLRFVTSDLALALPLPEEPRALPKKSSNSSGTDQVTDGGKSSALKKITDGLGLTNAGSGL